jgi:hypothetical protein
MLMFGGYVGCGHHADVRGVLWQKWVAGDSDQIKPHHLLIAGAIAGVPAASLTTPADVIKVTPPVVGHTTDSPAVMLTPFPLSIRRRACKWWPAPGR